MAGMAALISSTSLLAGAATTPSPVWIVAAQPDVFITEVQTASKTSASEEFIEFYNNTDHDVDFADKANGGKDSWKLQYFSGTKVTTSGVSDWTKPSGSIDLSAMTNTTISAHDYYVLAGSKTDGTAYEPGGIEADGNYSSRFADAAGLQLVDTISATAVTTVHDRVVWQKTTQPSLGVLSAPAADQSLQRIPNDDDEYVGQNGKLVDFAVQNPTSPRDEWRAPEPVPTDPGTGTTTGTDQTTDNDTDSGNGSTTSDDPAPLPLLVTELLPNPASPQTDEADEFIELYNPNTTAFDLNGYTLETGTTTLHDFTFTEHPSIPAQSYEAFYSSTTHLALSNSGGQVHLLDTSGQAVSQSAVYGTAADGQAWALIDDAWQWTTTPTPNEPNTLTTPGLAAVTKLVSTVSKKTTPKTVAKVKGVSTTKKPKQAKTTKAKTKKKATPPPSSSHLAAAVQPAPIHNGVLAAVALLAVLYGVYEYRVDLANRFYQFRKHRAARRTTRQKA